MVAAIDETNRRREKQVAYNTANGIDPTPLRKKIADITDLIAKEIEDTEETLPWGKKGALVSAGITPRDTTSMPRQELRALIDSLTDQMKSAAGDLQFEVAAKLRDEIRILKKELRSMEEAGV